MSTIDGGEVSTKLGFVVMAVAVCLVLVDIIVQQRVSFESSVAVFLIVGSVFTVSGTARRGD